MSLPNEDLIPIERLAPGVIVYRKGDDFGPFGAHAEVQTVEFDGEGYLVTALFEETDDEDACGSDQVQFWVRCGESVRHGGASAAILRQTSFVTTEEWQAKADANDRAIDEAIGKLNVLHGHVCREIDERPLVAAVADAIGVPALQAAE